MQQLLPLALSDDAEEFLHEAKRTKSGEIKQVAFPWLKKGNKQHKNWDNTVMGHVTVEQERLTLETNSEKRTKKGKKLLSKHLGEAIHFQQTQTETTEQKLKTMPLSTVQEKEDFNLLESPEAQEQIKAIAKAHWNEWFDKSVSVLDNKTPRQAAKTADGQEKLEALLMLYERHDLENSGHNIMKADIPYLRAELALD